MTESGSSTRRCHRVPARRPRRHPPRLAEALDAASQPRFKSRIESCRNSTPCSHAGVQRLGVTVPEIYENAKRATFSGDDQGLEKRRARRPVDHESRWSRPAARGAGQALRRRHCRPEVKSKTGQGVHLSPIGVCGNATRALRAGEIAEAYRTFLSFATNDLTQMTYGLSRDDAGRFMSAYVQQGVFPRRIPSPSSTVDGVGELMLLGPNGVAPRAVPT